MTSWLRTTLLSRMKVVEGEYVFPGRFGGHKTIQNNRTLEAAFRRAGATDVSSHNLRKTFATRLLSRGAVITDAQHLLGHASVETTEKAYAAFVKNERFKQTINLLNQPAYDYSSMQVDFPLNSDNGSINRQGFVKHAQEEATCVITHEESAESHVGCEHTADHESNTGKSSYKQAAKRLLALYEICDNEGRR